jgi:hypothetical protein
LISRQLAKSRPTDFALTEEHIGQLLLLLSNNEKPIEVYDVIDRLQLDVVTHIFFGESANSLEYNRQPFRDAMDALLTLNTTRVLFGSVIVPQEKTTEPPADNGQTTRPPLPRLDPSKQSDERFE